MKNKIHFISFSLNLISIQHFNLHDLNNEFSTSSKSGCKTGKRPPTSHDMPSSEKSTKRTSTACSFQHPLATSLERCVTTQSILWHYIEPITSSIDIDSIAFKCSLGKQLMRWFSQLIEKLFSSFLFFRLTIKTLSIFSLLQFNLFYWVVKKNHRIFIWPEAYFYNLICDDAQTTIEPLNISMANKFMVGIRLANLERIVMACIIQVVHRKMRLFFLPLLTNCNNVLSLLLIKNFSSLAHIR